MDYDRSSSEEMDVKLEPPESPDCFRGDERCVEESPEGDYSEGSMGENSPLGSEYCTSTSTLYIEGTGEDCKDGMPKRICLVCGDVASGLHYGVASCEACKAFFKRTIQGCIEYACPANGQCEITKRRRKACQACRFQKCLYMGMLREGVRRDRVRGGRQKYRRNVDHQMSPVVVMHHQSKPSSLSIHTSSHQQQLHSYQQQQQQQQRKSLLVNDWDFRFKTENSSKVTKYEGKLLAALMFIEPEKVYAMPEPSLLDDEYKFMITLSDLTDRELVATIGWAKQVPGFSSLPLHDQMNLLHGTWLDIVCLNVAYRSVPYNGHIYYADDFKVSEEDSAVYAVPRELDRVTRKLVSKLTELKVTHEEYVLMKALLLFNSDASLENPRGVDQQRERIYDTLVDHEGSQGSGCLPKRVSDLLLVLPLIVHNKFISREFWLLVRQDERIVLHKLLREMLDYAFN